MNVLVTLFLATTALWVFYWALVRVYLIEAVRYELEDIRIALDWAIIDGRAGSGSRAAQELSSRLKSAPRLSFGQVLYLYLRNRSRVKIEAVRVHGIYQASEVWIRDLWDRQTHASIKATLANSPSWWMPLAIIFLASLFWNKAKDWMTNLETATSLSPSDCYAAKSSSIVQT
jgi:hypothetical protein